LKRRTVPLFFPQIVLRENNAQGRTLKNEIDDLASKGILPTIMKDWSDNIRELGNDAAHPRIGGCVVNNYI